MRRANCACDSPAAVRASINTRARSNSSPRAAGQNDQCDTARFQVLLVPNAPVGCEQQVEVRLSAAFSSSPLLNVSQHLDCAVCTVCLGSARARPFGVPWSNRTSTGWDF